MSFNLHYFLFQIFPYISLMVCIVGCVLRFDRDPYSLRSKSSQLLRRRSLVVGSTLFHIGVLIILVGHAVGLLTPIVIFDAIGISHGAKQMLAIVAGGIAGVLALIGLLILLHRRLADDRIRVNSSFSDVLILVLLLAQLVLGLATIPLSLGHLDGHEMVKFMNWVQHIVTFRGGASEFIADVHIIFKLHLFLGMSIFLIFPFTRLVHILSAPVNYIFRKQYQIVRRRES